MPIKDKSKYPANWKQLRARRLEIAQNRCEFCGVENHTIVERIWKDGSRHNTKIVLTTAHLDQNPANDDINNLRMLCQQCHLRYDAGQHVRSRQKKAKVNLLDQ